MPETLRRTMLREPDMTIMASPAPPGSDTAPKICSAGWLCDRSSERKPVHPLSRRATLAPAAPAMTLRVPIIKPFY